MNAPLRWGALARWQAEVRNGVDGQRADAPSTWDYRDPVYRAAVVEAEARDARRGGLESHVEMLRAKYESILQEALRQAKDAT